MDITQLDQELKAKKIKSCYLLVGEERHLILTAQNLITKTVLQDSKESPDRFDASQTGLHKILDTLKTPSFLTPWRLVLVEEASEFKKKDWEELAQFLKIPLQRATLILVAETLSATALKQLGALVSVVECKKLYPRQVASWLNMEVKNLGLALSREAAQFLIDSVGTDLGALSQALEKLFLSGSKKGLIQLEDVETVVANTSQRNVFELTNAIGEKKPQAAVGILENILDQGEEPLKALALISRHFRLLARAQDILAKTGSESSPEFAKQLKVHPFFAKDYARQARTFKKARWQKRFGRLQACDRALKSSRLKPQFVLEKLIWDLCAD